MKKIISFLVVISVLVCLLSGCDNKKINVKLGLAAPAVTHGWVAGVTYYAEKYCKEGGIKYELASSADKDEMSANIDSLIDGGAQALVVWPQWSGMEEAAKAALEKEVPVVAFDVDINCDGVYKVTGNNYDMGYQCADYITNKVVENAVVVVLEVPSAGSVSELRKKGFYDYLKENNYNTENFIEISESGFSRDAGYSDMKKLLAENKHIDAVFSMDDEISIGVVKAVTESGRTDIKAVTGGGGMQEYFKMITDAKYSSLGLCSALYSPSMIEEAIKTAIDLCSGKSSSKVVVIPTTIVDSQNVNDFIDPQNTVY